jgi:hypothetical protein
MEKHTAMRGSLPLAIGLGVFALGLCVAVPAVRAGARQSEPAGFSYDDYAAVLSADVNGDGMVDYRALKANRAQLDAFARSLAALQPQVYNGWTDPQKIAFWINAYNGLTLKVIIDHYPIKSSFFASLRFPRNSIRQISGVWDEITFTVMGKPMTLEEIEHGTLRKQFHEPRIHVALVCAAMGCPPLLNEPYVAEKLDEQFAGRAKLFLGNGRKFRIDRRKGDVYLSPIFKWSGDDFVAVYGTDARFRGHSDAERAVLNFVAPFLSEADRRYLETGDYDVSYLDYDWSLNEQAAPTSAGD